MDGIAETPSPERTSDLAALIEAVRVAMRLEFGERLDTLHRFVDRRIAELSAEVHGAVQLVDYSETNLSGQLACIAEQVGRVVGAPAAATHNSGVELEAVVKLTEQAAGQIMEAAEAISHWIAEGAREPDAIAQLAERVNAIFEACTFQDLTGQRIRRAIEQLQNVENMLGGLVAIVPGGEPDAPSPSTADADAVTPDLRQADVDRMLAELF